MLNLEPGVKAAWPNRWSATVTSIALRSYSLSLCQSFLFGKKGVPVKRNVKLQIFPLSAAYPFTFYCRKFYNFSMARVSCSGPSLDCNDPCSSPCCTPELLQLRADTPRSFGSHQPMETNQELRYRDTAADSSLIFPALQLIRTPRPNQQLKKAKEKSTTGKDYSNTILTKADLNHWTRLGLPFVPLTQ